MSFRRVLFFGMIIACEILPYFAQFNLKAGNFLLFGQAEKSHYLHQGDQMEFSNFIRQERNERYAESDSEKIAQEVGKTEQNSENQLGDANEDKKNEARRKQRVCKGMPLCGRRNGDGRRQKHAAVHRQKQLADAFIQSMISMEGLGGKSVDQLIGEDKLNQANCVGWFRRRGSSSTTSSSVGAAGGEEGNAGGNAGGDAGGDADDSNLQTSRRLRARRRTTTTRRSRHN